MTLCKGLNVKYLSLNLFIFEEKQTVLIQSQSTSDLLNSSNITLKQLY